MIIEEKSVEIEVLTGLRIGGEKETFEVGGLDNPVIRIVYNNEKKVPIIPGSSLKGRMSALLEKEYGIKYKDGDLSKGLEGEIIGDYAIRFYELFRSTNGVKLVFSDLIPTEETIRLWKDLEEKELTYDIGTEIKVENVINRNTGTSTNLRKMERVVKGSKFKGVVTLVYESEDDKKRNFDKDIKILKRGFELVAKTYLGGCGSRGYGRIKIKFDNEEFGPNYISSTNTSGENGSRSN